MSLKVYAAIPVLNESENLPRLIGDLIKQKFVAWEAVICVNQPEEWWKINEKKAICDNNQVSLDWLRKLNHPSIHIIDRSSIGSGWKGKNHGVGWARKTGMDYVSSLAGNDDFIISMDADTAYQDNYFDSVIDAFSRHPAAYGLSAPYYHPLTDDEITNRCILRYEIYMRNYAINMLLIDNPYAFSAIGSGMACKASVYRKIGGITPKLSGEDFYFIQKIRKSGNIIVDSGVYIQPSPRFSDRVYFGTGPAMIKGREGNWDSYPIYAVASFQKVKETYNAFAGLYHADKPTPMDSMLNSMTKGLPVWQPLRENAATQTNFIKACTQRVDALRILQFLKETNTLYPGNNEQRLADFIGYHLNPDHGIREIIKNLSFETSPVKDLNNIRNYMAGYEMDLQKQKGIV